MEQENVPARRVSAAFAPSLFTSEKLCDENVPAWCSQEHLHFKCERVSVCTAPPRQVNLSALCSSGSGHIRYQ
ncbi:hypothetical protein MHYP_G00242520 [Metynnis hypsauchen]